MTPGQKMVAALYVDPRGPYFGRSDVDPWDAARDARLYSGPGPVVAHPPCGPWSQLSHFCTKQDPTLGPFAVEQVRRYGGVLEHPALSKLWKYCEIYRPGALPFVDRWGGYSIEVEQVRWGHAAMKRTWLYLVGIPRSSIGTLPPAREPTHVVTTSRRLWIGGRRVGLPKMSHRAHLTPPKFADFLLHLARQTKRNEE